MVEHFSIYHYGRYAGVSTQAGYRRECIYDDDDYITNKLLFMQERMYKTSGHSVMLCLYNIRQNKERTCIHVSYY